MKRVEIRLRKKACVFCHERRARYQYRGQVRWNRQHSACFRCFHSYSDRLRAASMATTAAATRSAENSLESTYGRVATEFEQCAYPTPPPLTTYAGAVDLTVTAEVVQHAVLLGGTI
jgi:hypothetical protein